MAYKLNPFTANFDYYESGDTIGKLSDVEFPTPPVTNDALVYNSVTGKWENKPIDELQLALKSQIFG